MKTPKNFIHLLAGSALVATQVTPYNVSAQDDFPPPPPAFEDDFPPPPPPAPSAGSFGGSRESNSSPAGSGETAAAGIMTKQQKDKFNRSGIEDMNNKNFPETIESFDFPNAEITDVIKTISELTGKNFVIDPGVRGKITIIAPSKITVAEAYKAFLSALAINGYTVVPSGSFMKVKNARNAQRDSIETYSGAYYPNDDQMITKIIHLKHISAEMIQRDLRMLASKDGDINIYAPTNSIILSDFGSNVDRVMKIITQLDVPGFEEQIEVVQVKHAKSKDMADLIDKIVNKGQKSSNTPQGGFSGGVPRFSRTSGGAQGQSGNASFIAFPDERTNSIIVVGNKAGIQRVKKLIAQLDFRIRPEENGGVYVYYVKHGDAEKIAQVMQGVTKDAAPKPASGGSAAGGFGGFGGFGGAQAATNEIFGGEVKITADKNTNSLVIIAAKPDYERVLTLISKIDIPRDLVFVETVIMEMAMQDTNDWKVGYFQYGSSGYGKTGFNGGVPLADLLSPTGGTGAVLGFAGGKTIEVSDPTKPGTKLSIPNITGFINFIKTNTRTNVLSTPNVIALDNEEALIEVGDRVATSVNQTTGTNGQTQLSANFEDATMMLKLKPFISKGTDSIRLEVKQSIKQPGVPQGPKAIQETTLPLQTRKIETHLVVRNGDTAVLGGLMKDQDSEDVKKVPLLGDLPLIGWLFKSRNVARNKVNLVVFLTPKIIRTARESNQILTQKLDERLDYVKGAGGRDPYGKKVDEIQSRINNPPPSTDLDTNSSFDLPPLPQENFTQEAAQPAPARAPKKAAAAPARQQQPPPPQPLDTTDDQDFETNPAPLTE